VQHHHLFLSCTRFPYEWLLLSRIEYFSLILLSLFLPDLFPVPTLITTFANKLFLTDIDNNDTIWELSAKTNVKDICYTANDDKVYYIVEDSLFLLNVQTASEFQVFFCSFPCSRESRKICVHYCHYFGAIHVFEEIKTAYFATETKQHDKQSKFNGKIQWRKQNWEDSVFLMMVGLYAI